MHTKLIELKEQNITIPVTENTQYVLVGESGTFDVVLEFDTEGITAEILGIFKLSENKNLNLSTTSSHNVSNTSCMTFIKSVLLDESKMDYLGKIIINKKGNLTNAFLNDRVLLIGDKAVSNSKPVLEIEANEVKASHGAAAGNINKEEIYYLMSRGLSEMQARNIIIEGFLYSIIDKIKDQKVRNIVLRKFKKDD